MEFLVEFDVKVPADASASEVDDRERAEAAAAEKLVDEGHLVRLWKPPAEAEENKALGLYRAGGRAQLDDLLDALPLRDWMCVTVRTLETHPNDPALHQGSPRLRPDAALGVRVPEPRLTFVYRLEASLGEPLDLGDVAQGHRRIVPQTGGRFTGPELSGKLLPGASADWQIVMPDGTSFADVRYTLQTDGGDLLYVRAQGVRHGSAQVLSRLARGEEVDAGEYTFRTSTRIETGAPHLDWLNKGVFISVGGRQAAGVIYETYLVG
jgi:muconolactone delta-isomerase